MRIGPCLIQYGKYYSLINFNEDYATHYQRGYTICHGGAVRGMLGKATQILFSFLLFITIHRRASSNRHLKQHTNLPIPIPLFPILINMYIPCISQYFPSSFHNSILSMSSNPIRVLPFVPNKTKPGRHTHSHPRNLVLASIQNLKRISELERELATSGQQRRQEMENFMEESRICQVELLQSIREGQFSKVYRVRLKATGKHLALKKIPLQDRYESREEEICPKMRSNFVVKTVDVYRSQGHLNILMQLYDWSLKDFILGEQRLQYLIFKAICYQMARAVFYLHSKAITHRDIRPDNFLMRKSGRVALGDFGSAKSIRKGDSSLAYLNGRSYRAPQLLLGGTNYASAVDIWALGCVMGELLTKKELFRGSSTIDCLLNICRVVGSKELRKLKEGEQLIRLLPSIKGVSLGEHLQGAGCPLLADLLEKMLRVRADERIRAVEVLVHPFFDELRDEVTFHEIMREKMDISDFFTFSGGELRNCEEYRTKLIPVWKRDRLDKHISTL